MGNCFEMKIRKSFLARPGGLGNSYIISNTKLQHAYKLQYAVSKGQLPFRLWACLHNDLCFNNLQYVLSHVNTGTRLVQPTRRQINIIFLPAMPLKEMLQL
jgi:hypothetical protein